MLKSQFDYLCEDFGDPSLELKDRWKSIKYIYVKVPLIDMQYLIKNNLIMYIDNEITGAGFFYLNRPNPDLEPINKGITITFIPLSAIDKITFISDFVIPQDSVSELYSPKPSDTIVQGLSFNRDTEDFSTIIT